LASGLTVWASAGGTVRWAVTIAGLRALLIRSTRQSKAMIFVRSSHPADSTDARVASVTSAGSGAAEGFWGSVLISM
jgi:hypothetical protein